MDLVKGHESRRLQQETKDQVSAAEMKAATSKNAVHDSGRDQMKRLLRAWKAAKDVQASASNQSTADPPITPGLGRPGHGRGHLLAHACALHSRARQRADLVVVVLLTMCTSVQAFVSRVAKTAEENRRSNIDFHRVAPLGSYRERTQ